MKLTIQAKDLPYARLLSIALPMMRQGLRLPENSVGKLAAMALELPEELLETLVDAMPPRELDAVLSMLIDEQQDPLLNRAEVFLAQQGIPVQLDRFTLSRELEAQLFLSELDYTSLTEKFLPLLQTKELQDSPDGFLAKLQRAPAFLVRTMVCAMPREKLDRAAVYLINRNAPRICRKLETMAAARGIPLEILGFQAEL